MGLVNNACVKCGKRGGLTKATEFAGQKLPGSLCKKCGSFIADKQSVTFDVSCDGCKKSMHYASIEAEVSIMETVTDDKGKKSQRKLVIHQGAPRKKYMCPPCSEKRVAKGEHDIDEVLTRYPIYCAGGCGNLQGYEDAFEGETIKNPTMGFCMACTPREQELQANDKALDDAAKSVAGGSGP